MTVGEWTDEWTPEQLREECLRQGRLATGAMKRLAEVEQERDQAREQLRGAVEALREAVAAARLFNRGGMTWLEYDRKLVEFERIASGGQ